MRKEFQVKWTLGKQGSDDAFYVRTKVFIIEQGYTMEFDDLDQVSWHLTIYDHDEPIAAARILQNDDGSWQIGRVCVLEEYRGQRAGEKIISAAEEKLRALGAKEARLSAQTGAKGFYQKYGYTEYGEEYSKEGCPHIAMKKIFQ